MLEAKNFSLLGIDHIGIAHRDYEKAQWFFGKVLGLESLGGEQIAEQGVEVAIFDCPSGAAQASRLELLEPIDETSAIAKYRQKYGGGIHHIALGVRKIDALAEYLLEKGVQLVNSRALAGAGGCRIIFAHPASTGGVLVEFVERPAR